jgi:hypothetical protein
MSFIDRHILLKTVWQNNKFYVVHTVQLVQFYTVFTRNTHFFIPFTNMCFSVL